MTLTTPRLTLRMPVEADWPAYCAYRLGARSTLPDGKRTEAVARSHFDSFAAHWAQRGFGRFVMVDRATGAAIGHVGPFEPEGHPERELTWTLWSAAHEGKGLAHEGKGLAHEGAQAARDHAFGSLGWATAVSYIVPGNARSRRLAERLGATLALAQYGSGRVVSYIDAANTRSARIAIAPGGQCDPVAEAALGEPDLLIYRHFAAEDRT